MDYIRKCNICGNIWCYTDEEIRENARHSLAGSLSSILSLSSAFLGSRYDMYEQNKIGNTARNKIVNYEKCPSCNSNDTVLISKEDTKNMRDIEEKKKNGFFKNTSLESLTQRVEMFIDNKDWISANLYLEQMIDIVQIDNSLEKANLYLLKLYVDNKVSNKKELMENCIFNKQTLNDNENFEYIKKFGNEKTIKELEEINEIVEEKLKEEKIQKEKQKQIQIQKEKQKQIQDKQKQIKDKKLFIKLFCAICLLIIVIQIVVFAKYI